MPEYMKILYEEIEGFYSFYVFLLVVFIGLYCLLIDYPILKKKKLKKEGKICKFIGWTYLMGGIGVYVIFKIF